MIESLTVFDICMYFISKSKKTIFGCSECPFDLTEACFLDSKNWLRRMNVK